MKEKLNPKKVTLNAALAYGVLKLPQQKIDPYTRTLIGLVAGYGMLLSDNHNVRNVGMGVMIAGALQFYDHIKGGKLSFNNGSTTVYVLDEQNGISVLAPGEIPKNYIDGFAFKGLNGIFKLVDGVYAGIDSNNKIKYSFGVGKYVNQLKNAGFKTLQWIENQPDLRWHELYKKTIAN